MYLAACYKELTGMLDKERAADVHLHIKKAFSTISHTILIDEFVKYRPFNQMER